MQSSTLPFNIYSVSLLALLLHFISLVVAVTWSQQYKYCYVIFLPCPSFVFFVSGYKEEDHTNVLHAVAHSLQITYIFLVLFFYFSDEEKQVGKNIYTVHAIK